MDELGIIILVFVFMLVGFMVLLGFAGIKIVPQDSNWTVERSGRYLRTLSPGLNLIVPFFERIGRKVDMTEQAVDIPQHDAITKDNAKVAVDGVAFYQVIDAARASHNVANVDHAVVELTMTNIRSVIGGMDLDRILSHRSEMTQQIRRAVDAAAAPWGVKVNRLEIKDIVPPADLVWRAPRAAASAARGA